MSATYQTFALKVPSGIWVEVRTPDAAVTLGRGVLPTPLLSAAMAAVAAADGEERTDEPEERRSLYAALTDFCSAVVVHPAVPDSVTWDEVPLADLYAIYRWAMTGEGDARPLPARRPWRPADFRAMVTGPSAVHLDLMCARYGVRPSVALGVAEAACAVDLDMAVAYRALKRESDSAEGIVEAKDALGGTHKVPRKWLPIGNVEPGAEVFNIEGRGPGTYSAGGLYGDGAIGPQPQSGAPRLSF